MLSFALSSGTFANPEGGNVVSGSANISANGKKLDVYQQSDRAVIDWRSFDIQIDEHTQFHQPSSSATALNRVNSADPSHILGQLSANGNVILVNPNGVFFGSGSKVDVNGLIATTSDITNADFMAGNLRFNIPGNPNAAIVNAGNISAKDAGLVALVAPNVANHGIITAKMGRVELASGDSFMVDLYGDGLYELKVSDEVLSQLVSNTGSIRAEGGTIAITAAAGKEIVNSLITIEGELRAPTIEEKGGKIIIAAEGSNAVQGNVEEDKDKKQGSSTVLVGNAYIDASGRDEGEQGGEIEITADNIGILQNTIIDASGHSAPVPEAKPDIEPSAAEGTSHASDDSSSSGDNNNNSSAAEGTSRASDDSSSSGGNNNNGTATMTENKDVRSEEEFLEHENRAGGSIKIGGDYLGTGDTATAEYVYVDQNSYIFNDAIESGDAGRTIIWSDHTTDFYGNVFARGGNEGGNGGFLETSGKKFLDAKGYADLTAIDGYKKGTYLLDPADITIYGNVDPTFVSTDGSVDLASDLQLWLDAADATQVELTYSTDSLGAATASGAMNTNTITTSADVSANLEVGARIRLGAAGAVTTADTLGTDTYTITAIAGTTITVQETLTANYTADALYRGLVSQWSDKSGNTNHATQGVAANMPLWVDNGLNGNSVINFDGVNDDLQTSTPVILETDDMSLLFHGTSAITRGRAGFGGFSLFLDDADIGRAVLTSGGNVGYTSTASNSPLGILLVDQNNPVIGQTTVQVFKAGEEGDLITAGKINLRNSTINLSIGYRNNVAEVGDVYDTISYNTAISDEARNLLEQYQSAKWDISLDLFPGAGTEAAEAMGDNGYSAFTTNYLERLSNTADIILQADNSITLDLQGDTLTLLDDRSITLRTTNGDINTLSTGSIITNRTNTGGNITLNAGGSGDININHIIALNAQNNGDITFTAGGNVNNEGNLSIISGRYNFGQSLNTIEKPSNTKVPSTVAIVSQESIDKIDGNTHYNANDIQNYTLETMSETSENNQSFYEDNSTTASQENASEEVKNDKNSKNDLKTKKSLGTKAKKILHGAVEIHPTLVKFFNITKAPNLFK